MKNINSSIFSSHQDGFTLLEVMISLIIVGGLLVTLISTLNYHLGIAERQGVVTEATLLAKEKIYEMEKTPLESKGNFKEPNDLFSFETYINEASFLGMKEIRVIVRKDKEEVKLSRLIRDL